MNRARLVVAAVVTSLLALVLTPAVAVGADSCTDFEFIGGRGSGQAVASDELGMGPELFKAYKEINAAVSSAGRTITGYGVNYPAVSVFGGDTTINGLRKALHLGGAYDASVAQGTQDVIDRITLRHAQCSAMKFIVGGYSQGGAYRWECGPEALCRSVLVDRSIALLRRPVVQR